jgi:hypothetical protein
MTVILKKNGVIFFILPDFFCSSRRELRELKANNSRWDLLIQIGSPNSSTFVIGK